MNRPIEHYISDLLYLHDCVIIPGFGGFVGNKKSAFIHPVS
ncbi:MAG: SPOR domain-containing protein, partial [Bacteroidota bacterium]|nr:SPOR domain-containing protein [Bacteroidota bacterium]